MVRIASAASAAVVSRRVLEGVRQDGLVDDLDRLAVLGEPDRAVGAACDLHRGQ